MKYYSVIKYTEKSDESWDYGILNETEMKAQVKGYKPFEFDTEFYFREKSQYYYIVKEVEVNEYNEVRYVG